MPEDYSDVQGGGSSTAPSAGDSYVVQQGDSLSKIAKARYGDARRWKAIYEANKDRITNPDHIEPGWTIRIP